MHCLIAVTELGEPIRVEITLLTESLAGADLLEYHIGRHTLRIPRGIRIEQAHLQRGTVGVSSGDLRILTLVQVALLLVHSAKVGWLIRLATVDLLLACLVVQAVIGCG